MSEAVVRILLFTLAWLGWVLLGIALGFILFGWYSGNWSLIFFLQPGYSAFSWALIGIFLVTITGIILIFLVNFLMQRRQPIMQSMENNSSQVKKSLESKDDKSNITVPKGHLTTPPPLGDKKKSQPIVLSSADSKNQGSKENPLLKLKQERPQQLEDYYKILGITSDADLSILRQAFKEKRNLLRQALEGEGGQRPWFEAINVSLALRYGEKFSALQYAYLLVETKLQREKSSKDSSFLKEQNEMLNTFGDLIYWINSSNKNPDEEKIIKIQLEDLTIEQGKIKTLLNGYKSHFEKIKEGFGTCKDSFEALRGYFSYNSEVVKDNLKKTLQSLAGPFFNSSKDDKKFSSESKEFSTGLEDKNPNTDIPISSAQVDIEIDASDHQEQMACLGIKGTSIKISEVRKAYKNKAREYHPDKNVGKEEKAKNDFNALRKAYEDLMNLSPGSKKYSDDPEIADLQREFEKRAAEIKANTKSLVELEKALELEGRRLEALENGFREEYEIAHKELDESNAAFHRALGEQTAEWDKRAEKRAAELRRKEEEQDAKLRKTEEEQDAKLYQIRAKWREEDARELQQQQYINVLTQIVLAKTQQNDQGNNENCQNPSTLTSDVQSPSSFFQASGDQKEINPQSNSSEVSSLSSNPSDRLNLQLSGKP